MPLLDQKTADEMSALRQVAIARALSVPEVKAALDVLIENDIEPGIVHGCLTHLRRQNFINAK